MTKITTDEWLAELERVYSPNDADGMTAIEIAEAMGKGVAAARIYLGRAIRAGVWELAGKAQRPAIDGRICRVPVYRPVKEPK